MSRPTLRLGLDVGSTTVKLVLLNGDSLEYATYRRHHADITGELDEVYTDVLAQFPDADVIAGVTGSGGLGVAQILGIPFVQEVIAGTAAITHKDPHADVVIELGGEDAKITFLKPVPEQRMNGTCAGGTGAFIDQMATLLGTDAAGLDELAGRHTTLYPIASRCGVFAKSDLQPLLNEGAPHADLAASIFAAVATQTIAGLACGRPIRGSVVLLGGPFHFLPRLREAYARALGDKATSIHTPEAAQLYVAIGAALLAESAPIPLAELVNRARSGRRVTAGMHRMRPLFADEAERSEFEARHRSAVIPRGRLESATGDCFLGIDAGSTTIKAVLVDDRRRIVFSHYAGNEGDPVGAAVAILARIYEDLPDTARIARTCTTGYGEGLVKAALRAEDGEVETMAHYRAADHLCPGVTSVIDIGGQDMKYLRIHEGTIDSIAVNEACSSGCGSFLQTFATTMGTDVEEFAARAVASGAPVDLGSRCTVFMNSSVKQAQKEGASPGEIAAGLSYSVVRNALHKVIKIKDPAELGDRVVVQGGTFLNDAVLRAFELLTERDVVRPDIAGLMGAFGAALTARENNHRATGTEPDGGPTLRPRSELRDFSIGSEQSTCEQCANHCRRTVTTFDDGAQHISGNRCERGETLERPRGKRASTLPNVVDEKYRRLFAYRRLTESAAHRGDIGLPRTLNMYENYPFWFTTLSHLGFRVLASGRSSHELFERGMDSIPSENICYPAKLSHGHIADLVSRGVRTIFYPCVRFERRVTAGADGHFSCPVVASQPEVIDKNVESLRAEGVRLLTPFLNLDDPVTLARRLAETFADDGVTLAQAAAALQAGYAEDAAVRADIARMGRAALDFMERTGRPGIVLAGRPYHVDPEVHHGIPELINSLGMAVLTEDSVSPLGEPLLERPLRVRDQWAYHSRLYAAAAFVASRPDLEMVELNSFGCGLDAIAGDQVGEILEARGRIHTAMKIDEVAALGAARIRVRSLQAASRARASRDRRVAASSSHVVPRVEFTEQMRGEHTILMGQLAPAHMPLFTAALQRSGYRVRHLDSVGRPAVEAGLRFVNNDACFPALVIIGQALEALRSGEADPARTTVLLVQTGGMCRATNYVSLTRKALVDSGFGHVPVLALSFGGLESHSGFSLTLPMMHRLIQAIVLGDVLQSVLLRTRPYEAAEGSADALYRQWSHIAQEFLRNGRSDLLSRRVSYGGLIREIAAAFDGLTLRDVPRRPRVGVVGEILVKYHHDANNHVVEVLEADGCEAVVPGLMGFVLNSLHTGQFNWETFGTDRRARHVKKALTRLIEHYESPARAALAGTGGKFDVRTPIANLAAKASGLVSLGNQAGEGWYLVGEMVDLIDHGIPNIVCVQPFACLPNHSMGKGMFHSLRQRYPGANIVGVDYDPGASEVNQLNRIRLMTATALGAHKRETPADTTADVDSGAVTARRR